MELLVKWLQNLHFVGYILKNTPMNEILQYNDEASSKLLEMYRTPDIQNQYREFLQFLRSAPGQRILDVGSGPGLFTSTLANAVGASGWVCGIDISDQMLAIAKSYCAQQSWVEFKKAEAAHLPFPDQHFDVLVCMQVLEYISDVPTVLSEFQRVLRTGGQVILMDTDWDSLVWYSPAAEIANQILAEWNKHLANPYLPRTLTQLLLGAGFQVERPHILPIFNPNYAVNTFSNRLIDLIVAFVSGRGKIPPSKVEAWGRYFFSLNPT